MRLTPIEIRQHRFKTRFRGHDQDEVNAFLDMVVSDYRAAVFDPSTSNLPFEEVFHRS